jgi:hypothetical protein
MFKKNTAVTGFGIGHFINASTGAAVTTGTPTCKRTLDGTGGSCANAASYNSDGAVWEIDLAAGDLNGDVVILSFTLTDCLPIAYTIRTTTGIPDASGYFPADAVAVSGDTAAADALEDFFDDATSVTNLKAMFDGTGYAGGTTKLSVNAAQIGGTTQTGRDIGASVLLSSGTGTGQISLSSGAVTVGTNNDKTGYTASTVSDKTGYSLVATTGLGNQTANITGTISTVTTVTNAVTVGTNNDKTGYSLTATTGLGNQTANITGNLSGSVGSVASGGITATSIADGAIDAATFAADVDAEIAAMVWNAAISSYGTSGSYGEALEAVGAAADPWLTPLPGAYGAGTAGYIIGTASTLTASDIADAVWNETSTGHTDAGKAGAQLWTDLDAVLADTNELQTDWVNGGRLDLILDARSSHTAADVVTAMGTGTFLSAIPWNAAWDSEVQSECTDALNVYDPPTHAEVTTAINTAWSTTTLTEDYASEGTACTPAELLYMIYAAVAQFVVSGTTITAYKLDGSTTAMTFDMDSATAPTYRKRAS